jgi:ATPase subunit of ABC transporter with duplicated ATPase domains
MAQRDPTRLEKINARFAKVDWTSFESMAKTLPAYKQELIALKNVKNVSKRVNLEIFNLWTPFKDKQLFKSTELIVEPRRHYALFGQNGSGKSTLFAAMCDGSLYEQGFPKHLSTLHMQEIETSPDNGTLMETVLQSHELLYVLRKCRAKLTELIAEHGEEKYAENMKFVQEELRLCRSDTAEQRISRMLQPLGFDEKAQQKNVNSLSGGLRMRVALVCAFFQEPDLLCLDDPTNHLDFPSVLWLENRLRGYSGSFILVTHDRNLLENVCNAVILIEDQELLNYKMDFNQFEKTKTRQDEKKYREREMFVQRNRNPDPSTPTGRRVQNYRAWIKAYSNRQFAKNNMFTFPHPRPSQGLRRDSQGRDPFDRDEGRHL